TRIDGIERCRAADVEPVALHPAEAQVGDGFRNVDLAEQIAAWGVAAPAVFVRIAPADGAPHTSLGVAAHSVANSGLGHIGEDLAVRHLSGPDIHVEYAKVRGVVRAIGGA